MTSKITTIETTTDKETMPNGNDHCWGYRDVPVPQTSIVYKVACETESAVYILENSTKFFFFLGGGYKEGEKKRIEAAKYENQGKRANMKEKSKIKKNEK
jgi:hypothetical protein